MSNGLACQKVNLSFLHDGFLGIEKSDAVCFVGNGLKKKIQKNPQKPLPIKLTVGIPCLFLTARVQTHKFGKP